MLILALPTLACGVRGREELIGRYVVAATGETWTLRDDGGCTIERGGVAEPCEWEYREGPDGTRLMVTVTSAAGAAARHTLRYVLAPSKWPGQPVTIPLSPSATLEKRDGPAGPGATR